jgi:hypothetical protein
MPTAKFTVELANWFSQKQFNQEFTPEHQHFLITYLEILFARYPELTPTCYWFILETYGRIIRHPELRQKLAPFLMDVKKPLPQDKVTVLSFIFAIHLSLKYILDNSTIYDLIDLKTSTPQFKGLDYVDCEALFLNLLDWNLNSIFDKPTWPLVNQEFYSLFCFLEIDEHAVLPQSIHPWQMIWDLKKENVFFHPMSQKALLSSYQLFCLPTVASPSAQQQDTVPSVSHKLEKSFRQMGKKIQKMTINEAPRQYTWVPYCHNRAR